MGRERSNQMETVMTVSKKKAPKNLAYMTGKEAANMGIETIYVSQSKIKTWRRCHAKHDYRYNQNLEKKRRAVQLFRGSILGECIDSIYARRVNPQAPGFETVLREYEKEYKKLFQEEREFYGDLIGECRRITLAYEALYAKDGMKPIVGKDGNPFELELRVPLIPGVIFKGKIDKLFEDRNKRVWLTDHKSHKKIPDLESRFSDIQLVLYYWAVPLTGYKTPDGVMWDYIRTKAPTIPDTLKAGGLSKRANIDTTYETYLAEITRQKLNPKDYKEILDPLKGRGTIDFYQRVQLAKPNPKLVENIVSDARQTALEIQLHGKTSKVRSMSYDCKQCDYYQLCQSDARGLDTAFIRKTDYQPRKEEESVDGDQEESQ